MNQPTKPDDFLPLPHHAKIEYGIKFYTADQVHAAILADRANRPAVAGSVDTLEFRVLLTDVCAAYNSGLSVLKRERALIDHINALIVQAAPSGEAVAWATSDGKECVSAESKRWMKGAGFGAWSEAAAKYVTPLYTHPAPRDVDAPIVLPEKPVFDKGMLYSDETLDSYATAAVQKDRADWKETK